MPIASTSGIDLYYETYGKQSDPPLLLVCGLGMQMAAWSDEWVDDLVERGFYVLAFDNRDSGLSTHLVDAGTPDLMGLFEGRDPNISYLVSDMAADAVAVLDHAGVEAAHLVGVSMGGMIVQQLAIEFPDRVLSLCSIMSTTGDNTVGQPSEEAAGALLTLEGDSREDAIENAVKSFSIFGSPGFPPDEPRLRHLAGVCYDRNHEPTGFQRQLGACIASPDRTERLALVLVPTLVIHGSDDRLINHSGGEATAKAVQGARLVTIEGMGHDLPLPLWPQIMDEVCTNAGQVSPALLASLASS